MDVSKETKEVLANKWPEMSLEDLWSQKEIMNERMAFAKRIGHEEIIKSLSRGFIALNALIDKKASEQDSRLI